MGWTAWSQKVLLSPRLRGRQLPAEWHTCLDAVSPDCLLGAQLCACVIMKNKVVEQPVPSQEVQEAAMNSVIVAVAEEMGFFPRRGSSSGVAVAVESGSGHL